MLTRGRRSVLAGATGAVIAFLAITALGAPGGAAPGSDCSASAGVTVIVDFTHFNGAIEHGCAGGQPATALDAIQSAGFHTTGTTNYGDAFVCRIDGLPSARSEACVATPPGNASWSFYFAEPSDAAWTYSTTGVTSFHPAAGTILAFAFGNYAKPAVRPSGALPAPPTTPPTTARATPPTAAPPPTVPPTGPRVTAEAAPPVTVNEPAARRATTAPTRPPAPGTTASTPSPSTTPTASSARVRFIDRSAAPAGPGDSSGTPVPALLTVGLVAVLGAAALVTVRSRRGRST